MSQGGRPAQRAAWTPTLVLAPLRGPAAWLLLAAGGVAAAVVAYRWARGHEDPFVNVVLLVLVGWTLLLGVVAGEPRRPLLAATPYALAALVLTTLAFLQATGDPGLVRHTNSLLGAYLALPVVYLLFFLLRRPSEALAAAIATLVAAAVLQLALPSAVAGRHTAGVWVGLLTATWHGLLLLLFYAVPRLRSNRDLLEAVIGSSRDAVVLVAPAREEGAAAVRRPRGVQARRPRARGGRRGGGPVQGDVRERSGPPRVRRPAGPRPPGGRPALGRSGAARAPRGGAGAGHGGEAERVPADAGRPGLVPRHRDALLGRAGRHVRGHQRAQGDRDAGAGAGPHRPAHRAREQARLRGRGRPAPRRGREGRPRRGHVLPRPRRVQGRQRRLRPRDGRRAAAARGWPPALGRPRGRPDRPHRRRRVRRPGRGPERRRRRGLLPARARGRRRPLLRRWGAAGPDVEPRGRDPGPHPGWQPGARRRRHVPRQGAGRGSGARRGAGLGGPGRGSQGRVAAGHGSGPPRPAARPSVLLLPTR